MLLLGDFVELVTYGEFYLFQFPALCDDDLQSVVQMGLNQNPRKDMALRAQNYPGNVRIWV